MGEQEERCMQCLKCGHEQDLGTFDLVRLPLCGETYTFRTCTRCGRFCCQLVKEHRKQHEPDARSE